MYLCNIQFKLISTILQFIIFKYIQKKKKKKKKKKIKKKKK